MRVKVSLVLAYHTYAKYGESSVFTCVCHSVHWGEGASIWWYRWMQPTPLPQVGGMHPLLQNYEPPVRSIRLFVSEHTLSLLTAEHTITRMHMKVCYTLYRYSHYSPLIIPSHVRTWKCVTHCTDTVSTHCWVYHHTYMHESVLHIVQIQSLLTAECTITHTCMKVCYTLYRYSHYSLLSVPSLVRAWKCVTHCTDTVTTHRWSYHHSYVHESVLHIVQIQSLVTADCTITRTCMKVCYTLYRYSHYSLLSVPSLVSAWKCVTHCTDKVTTHRWPYHHTYTHEIVLHIVQIQSLLTAECTITCTCMKVCYTLYRYSHYSPLSVPSLVCAWKCVTHCTDTVTTHCWVYHHSYAHESVLHIVQIQSLLTTECTITRMCMKECYTLHRYSHYSLLSVPSLVCALKCVTHVQIQSATDAFQQKTEINYVTHL